MSTQTGGDPTVAHPIRVGDVPTDHEHCEKVTGFWTRANVVSEHDQDYNSGIYPKECRFVDPKLKDNLMREYRRTTDPRCVMAFLNGEYAPDGARDTWVTSFKSGKGDCDSKALAAADIAYTYFKPTESEWGWIPMVAIDAWLEGPDGRGGTTRTPTAHAFNVFVRSGFTEHCNPVDCIKIGEPTYSCTSFDDKGPGSGHIIKVSWLLYPNPGSTKHSGKTVSGSAIAVDAAHNMGQHIAPGHENVVLLQAIKDAILLREEKIVCSRVIKYRPTYSTKIESNSTNGQDMPIMTESRRVV